MNGSRLPFPTAEYRDRQARVRAAMAARGVDVLYVTSPANLLYLTGYEAVWYPPRLPLGAAIVRDEETVTVFDWSRHADYVEACVLADDVVLFDYADAAAVAADAFLRRGWHRRTVGLEASSPSPAAATFLQLRGALAAAGAALADGDWLVDDVRLYKSEAEVERIRRAAAIADRAMQRLAGELRPGLTGIEVSARVLALLADAGGEVPAMPPLVSAGPDAWLDTHALPGHRPLEAGDVVSVDLCGVVDRYHVNLERTFGLGSGVSPLARELVAQAAGSVDVLVAESRLGEGPEAAAAAAERHVRARIAPERIWWIGGYALGLALPPSWVGHAYLANDGPRPCAWRPGYVSNFEAILHSRAEGFAAGFIETVLMTGAGLEVLSRLPRTMCDVGG